MSGHQPGRSREELLDVIRRVRRRWRTRHLLRGLLVTGAALAAALLVVGVGIHRWVGSPGTAVVLAAAVYLGVAVVAGITLVRPLLRRVTHRQVALYLEEREPALKAQLVTAVEGLEEREGVSSELLEELVWEAVLRTREVEGGRRVDRVPLRRLSWTTAAAILLVAIFATLDPGGIRTSLPELVRPWTAVEAAPARTLSVLPGDTVVPRGSELRLHVRPGGFEPSQVEVALRSGQDLQWDRWPMSEGGPEGEHAFVLFRVEEELEYYAEAEGVRSSVHRVEVRDLPYASPLEVEVEPPAYSGRPVQRLEDGGDLAVLAGTTVRVRAHPTVPVAAGKVIVDGTGEVALEEEDGVLVGEFRVQDPGFYRVELEDGEGRVHRGSPDYVIDVLEDLPPQVTLTQPARDLRATSVEEVYLEARATDDHGVAALDLVIAVNGGPPDTVSLLRGSGAPTPEVSAGHTVFLEEWDLEPGDLVSYHARALDNGPGAGDREARTDLFFIQIRPFSQEFRQADEAPAGMQGGGGDGGEMSGQLSRRQREIVTATFNVDRDRGRYGAGELEENLATIALAQERLRDEVSTLARRMEERGTLDSDPEMRQVAEELPQAADAMTEALGELREGRAQDALPPEQRALQHLLRAEAAFREIQLAWGPQDPGGGGGGEPGQDLADFFDLEMDRLRNQYETLQQGSQQEADRELDATLDRLRELARRQQQEGERLRRATQDLPPGAGGAGGESQRRLAEETEEAARQLERLAREQASPELEASARRLQQAAEAMRRAAASRDAGGVREAEEAAEALEEARRLLDRSRDARLDRSGEAAGDRMQRAIRRQERIQEEVEALPDSPRDRAGHVEPIVEQKELLRDELEGLESELRRIGREAASGDPQAGRGFQEAADALRDGRMAERIDYSRTLLDRGAAGPVREFEEEVTDRLREVGARVAEAVDALAQRSRDRRAELEERTRNLLRGAESLEARAQEGGGDGVPEGVPQEGVGGGLDEETLRQLQREAEARAREAEELGRALSDSGVDYGGMSSVIQSFRTLGSAEPYNDPQGLARLQRELVEELRALDFVVRRQLAGSARETPAAVGPGEVPEAYRDRVEEYFRSLARPPQ